MRIGYNSKGHSDFQGFDFKDVVRNDDYDSNKRSDGLTSSAATLTRLREYIHIYTLSYYHNQIGSMNYYILLRIRS